MTRVSRFDVHQPARPAVGYRSCAMQHELERVMREADRFVLIGDSSEQRFPAMSYDCYTKVNKPFYCLDLGGLTLSRGPTKGGKVYTRVADLPEDRGDLAILWVRPRSARRAVEVAHEAGCKRVWLSFGTGHRSAVERARELGMTVVEIGRCPANYLARQTPVCRIHTSVMQLSGAYRKPPQLDPTARRRELI
jgi:predicted CoA-binding protein